MMSSLVKTPEATATQLLPKCLMCTHSIPLEQTFIESSKNGQNRDGLLAQLQQSDEVSKTQNE